MSVEVEVAVEIARTRAEVAALMFAPEFDARWTSGVVAVRLLTPELEGGGQMIAGSRVERVSKFLGRRFGYLVEVVASEPDRFVEMKVEKPFPMHIRYQLEALSDARTRASIRTEGSPGGFFKLAGSLMEGMVRRSIEQDLSNLKREVEGS